MILNILKYNRNESIKNFSYSIVKLPNKPLNWPNNCFEKVNIN